MSSSTTAASTPTTSGTATESHRRSSSPSPHSRSAKPRLFLRPIEEVKASEAPDVRPHYAHSGYCHACGHKLEAPEALRGIHFTRSSHLWLATLLYRRKGHTVYFHEFGPRSIVSLRVMISSLREAFKDSGAPFRVRSIVGEGYMLEEIDS